MAQWSVPLQAGWKMRVTTGNSAGKEFPLARGRHVLGSQAGVSIQVPHPSIAPRHLTLEVHADHVMLWDQSGRKDMRVNGAVQASYRAGPGDEVQLGSFAFQLVNSAVASAAPPPQTDWWGRQAQAGQALWAGVPLHWRVALVLGVISASLLAFLVLTGNAILVPVTLLAASAVVPATVLTYLVGKYDQTGISFRTLGVTFLLGGGLGIVITLILAEVAGLLTLGLILVPIFAGVFEEPSKLAATAWRWRHPGYDRPLDGLILGVASGFGFAVFETAGYLFVSLLEDGLLSLAVVLVLRSLGAPFTHGLWTGLVGAAFWECGRSLRRAWRDRRFLVALGLAVGLHALWNLGAMLSCFGYLLCLASAVLTVWVFRRRLARQGYSR